MRVGSLGDVVFETGTERVFTPHAMSRSRAARYEDHQVQGDAPRSEFLAPELAGFDLSIRLRSSLGVDPLSMADQIAAYCTSGEVVRLIIAGCNLGKVTVRSVDETWRYLAPGRSGVQAVDLSVSLKEYV